MTPELGQTYRVTHTRKGVFHARVDALDDTWATLTVTAGVAGAMCAYNEVGEGEQLTVRRAFCRFDVPLPAATQAAGVVGMR